MLLEIVEELNLVNDKYYLVECELEFLKDEL